MKLLLMNTTACDGSDVFWTWILWLLAAFILGFILGWLLKQIFDSGAGSAGSDLKQDLTKIEGIGPKIEGLINKKGITSYRQLSNASHSLLEQMIEDAGPAFTTHRGMTNTWSAQAKLAELGEWDQLKKWQDMLKSGM